MSQNTTTTENGASGKGRDRAITSGWLPAEIVGDWPPLSTHQLIVDRRRTLYESMQDLEAAAARAGGQPDWMEQIERALETLSAALDKHVSEIEAPDGLFDEVLDRAPRLGPVVESLREDHDQMRAACRSALETARTRPDTQPRQMRREIMVILGRLAMHRQDGAELLFDTHNVDVPAGD